MNDADKRLNDKLNEACSCLSRLMDDAGLIEPSGLDQILKEFKELRNEADRRSAKFTYSIGLVNKTLKSNIIRFQNLYDNLPQTMMAHNERVSQRLAIGIGRRINPVEGCNLDQQQLVAIAYDVRTRLVIAGAGTGKTTTIVGLVKDIIYSGKAEAEGILLLSFTNASVNELKERIQNETGQRIEVTTFHRLGLKVIAESQGKIPKISNTDVRKFIIDEMIRRKDDPVYSRKLNEYMAYDFGTSYDDNQYSSGSELQAYLLENPLYTLNGEKVKSHGESDIANYLALNGIPYIYEDSYQYDTADSQYGQYHPDFHIEGTDIYIEYFGIDRDGNVAKFMIDKNPNAAEEYRRGMEWKRDIHKAKGTRLIELYAYERSEGELLDRLEQKLKELNIEGKPQTQEAILNMVFEEDKWKLNAVASIFTTIIILIKGFGQPWEKVFPTGSGRREKHYLRRIEDVLRPLYDAYQAHLSDRQEIDFEDMLNLASKHISEGHFIHPYKYVVVDEYQDISRSRYSLLSALRKSKDFNLFCVGDDWQSIYRFNGCDVSYILDFERYWGPSAICMIERTYRFSGELLEKSSDFISRNAKQYRKHLVGGSGNSRVYPLFAPTEHEIRQRIAEVILAIPSGKKVMFLGRYNHDVSILSEDGFIWKPSLSDSSSIVTYSGRSDLDMKFMTIHSSKGLQADVVISLNNKTGRYGFPSRRDEPVLIPMLLGDDSSQYDEERRLFYVAMTRAKDAAYIVSMTGHQSDFFKEMFPYYGRDSGQAQMICPICGGVLIMKNGQYGRFYGCSNYISKGCRFTRRLNE